MAHAALTLKELAQLGAHLEITPEGGYSPLTLKEIIGIAVKNGGSVTIHAGTYSSLNLKEMVTLGKGKVTLIV